ncbi:MFS general substrate transporter [Patellaria atrata CBS 101060]|uniref:MFS general substrate transporter n=1 Tax=Patellaria atrata CBS 101060 TaxID=1346257 RepID=A0A9P4SGR6_9PEZI|nr:MFS general substrate transporter [Patellaria atrata CBS 101060]
MEGKSSTSTSTPQESSEPIIADTKRSLARPSSRSSSTLSSDLSSTHSTDSDSSNQDAHSLQVYNSEPDCTLSPQVSRQTSKNAVPLTRLATGRSTATNATTDPRYEVDFEEDDPKNPRNWPFWYRGIIIFLISYSTMVVVCYSTSYTSGIPGMMSSFNIRSETVVVLGITTYLCGLAAGSVVLAPLSEMYGRRPVYLVSMTLFTILVVPCALAPNLEAVLVSRFFGAFFGAAMIGNAPGTVSDIVPDEWRALAFSCWSIGPMNGPVIGPVIGGFVFQYLGWRWTNWIVLIMGGAALGCICLIKETYAPALLRQQAARKRKETGDSRWWSRYDDKASFASLLKLNLSRPFVMAFTEPICIFWNLYIAVVYAVLYLCFVAYPIIFSQMRHWEPGFVGLAYSGIGCGTLIAIVCEPLIRRMINSHAPDPETARVPPEAMVSIVCIGAFCIPIGELIFAWTCAPHIPWIAPILAGLPFGFGNGAVFIYASNYLVHSYGIYAASALAGNAVLRSAMGGTLPLAGPKMYATLGPEWAGTLLGLLELALVPIPLIFYRYGHRIRMKSVLIRQMRDDQAKLEGKKARATEKSRQKEEIEDKGKEKEMGLESKELEPAEV